MEKRVGTSAGLLALLAFIMHTLMPPSSEQERGRVANSSADSSSVSPKTSAARALSAKQAPEEGPWLASRQYLHQEPSPGFTTPCIDYVLPPIDDPVSAHPNASCDTAAMKTLFGFGTSFAMDQVEAVIATIPDPLHTRMSLEADRFLDAIQDGAFAANWELATQWLPWTAKSAKLSASPKTEIIAPYLNLEKLPGLIVFRRKFMTASDADRVLLIFVVGETPTAGINGFQFDVARHCVQKLTGQNISVLGPNFSGSFLSLTRLVESDGGSGQYDIHSGSVSNSGYARSMLERLTGHPTNHRKVTFHGSTLPSLSFEAQFRRVAVNLGFVDSRELGELVEDDSGFSVGVDASIVHFGGEPNTKLTSYRYPRDIAQLRDAYSDIAFSGTQKGEAGLPQTLQLSLKDPQTGESDFPMFSTSHTPVSQDAILEQVIRELKRKRVRLLSLSASSVFDTLFIANVLARECPDLRIVLPGADLLFVEQAVQNSLSGILAISPFPMFSEGFQLANGEHVPGTFADADSVGEYNATLAVLHGDIKKLFAFAPPLKQGKESFSSDWLLVLGRQGWAPVDLLGQQNRMISEHIGAASTWFDVSTKPGRRESYGALHIPIPPLSRLWIVLCLLAACLSLGFSSRWSFLRLRPKLRTWSVLCSMDLRGGGRISRSAHARYICLLGCLSSLIFLNGLLLLPMSLDENPTLCVLVSAACIFPTAIAVLLFVRIIFFKSASSDFATQVTARYVWGAAGIRLLIFLSPFGGLFIWNGLCRDGGARGSFFRFRVLSLALPISPIWPLLLGTSAFLVIAFFHLRRLTWADRLNPALETSSLDRWVWGELGSAYQALGRVLSGPANTRLCVRWAGLGTIGFIAVIVTFVFPEDSLRSFESRNYETMLIVIFALVSMMLTGGLIRFASSWRILRSFLTILNSLDIGAFFGPMPDFEGGGPIWIRDLKLMSLATSVNSSIALHNLKLEMPRVRLDPLDYWKALAAFLSPQPSRDRRQILVEYQEFMEQGAEMSKIVWADVLEPYWERNKISFVQSGLERKKVIMSAPLSFAAAATDSRSLSGGVHSSQVTSYAYEMASEYVSLHYAAFIGYALRHIQNLLLCSVLAFVFLVLAFNSFSFQAPQTISHATVVALVAGGIVVIRVLAQIERNPIISCMSGNDAGELGKDFYLRVMTYGALPVLTVLSTQFPAVAHFLTSWAEPTLQALK